MGLAHRSAGGERLVVGVRDRGVEALPGAVEPLLADRARASRRAPTAPATPRGVVPPGLEARGPPRSAPRGPPRSSASVCSLIGVVSSAVRAPVDRRRCRSSWRAMRPSATRTLRRAGPASTPADAGDDVAVGVLDHGVARAQRGQRGQRPGPGALVADVVGGPVERVADGAAGPVAQARRPRRSGRRAALRGVGQRRAGTRSASSPACSRSSQLRIGDRGAGRAPGSTPLQLLGDVGHDQLGGVGRRGGADVGDQVEQRAVRLVADRRDDRRADARARPGPAPRRRTAAGPRPSRRRGRPRSRRPSGSRSSRLERPRSPRAAERGALHRGVRRPRSATAGPAAAGVLQHVALGGAVGRGDQADAAGQERQRPLAARRRTAPRRRAAGGGARAGRAARRARPSGSRGRSSESVPRLA